MTVHNYIAERAKGFRTRVTVGSGDDAVDHLVQFEQGQFKTEDDQIAEQLDSAIAKGTVSRFCRKVDRAAAEALAADFLNKQRRMSGVKGQLSALAAQQSMRTEVAQRDEVIAQSGMDTAAVAEESNLMLTEPVPVTRIQEVAPQVLAEADSASVALAAKAPAAAIQLGSAKT